MSEQVGSIYFDLDLDDKRFSSKLSGAKREAESFAARVQGKFGEISEASNSIANGLGTILKGAIALAAGGTFGFGAMTKAAWNQVSAVEDATFALRAYEKDAGKVERILGDLVAFARSDMGVLFQREELFKAASNLRGFGEEADKVVDRVKILSKGVALGMTNFDELSQIIGRTTQSGKLTAQAFDQLAYRGIILDSSLRGASVSADELYEALDNAIDDKVLEGRAETIQGRLIRLQSAFRDLGGTILGVDKDTSTFIKGGLGDTLITTMERLREVLRSPEMVETFQNIGKSIGELAATALPLLIDAMKWVIQNSGTLAAGLAGLTAAFLAAKMAAIGFAIAAALNPLTLIIGTIVGAIGLITFLGIKFGFLGDIFEALKPVAKGVADALKSIFEWGKDIITTTDWPGVLANALQILQPYIDAAKFVFEGLWSVMSDIGAFIVTSFVPSIMQVVQWMQQFGVIGAIVDMVRMAVGLFIVAWKLIQPAVTSLVNVVVTQLLPALMNLFTAIAPVLMPVLRTLIQVLTIIGTVIGGILIGAIWLAINALKVFILIFSQLIQVIAFVVGVISGILAGIFEVFTWPFRAAYTFIKGLISGKNFGDIFREIVRAIMDALSGVFSGITAPFSKAFDWIKNKAGGVKDALNNLNPFTRHSPSLVDWITRGTKVITAQYEDMFTQLEQMAASARPELTAAVAGAVGEGGGGTSVTNNIFGGVNIASQQDADYLLGQMAFSNEVTSRGMTG